VPFSENVALITRNENELSTVTEAEAEALLEVEDAHMKDEPMQNDDLEDLVSFTVC